MLSYKGKEKIDMFNAKKAASIALAGAVALSGSAILSGCSQVRQLIGQGEFGEKLMSSRHVDAKDRENYVQLQDAYGTVFVSVIYLEENDDTHFNVDEAKARFDELGLNWYQMIASSSMGTNTRETCYLYFPSNYTLTELFDIVNLLTQGQYNAWVLTQDQYDEYVNGVNEYDLYRNETTFFGPAAQPAEEQAPAEGEIQIEETQVEEQD